MTTTERLPEALLERLASAAVAEGLADAVYAQLESSPIGRLTVVQTEAGVCRVAFAEEPEARLLADIAERIGPRVVRSRSESAALLDALAAYLEGDRPDLADLPVDLRLAHAPFRHAVLEQLHNTVPAGTVVTYAELARRAGNPRAARATGSACATNPIPLIVPCHRVLPSSGQLGNYGGGVERKALLLALEGAALSTSSPRS